MLIIVYIEGMRIEIPITSARYRGFSGVYPIKLLYVSNIPVILTGALIANINFFGQYLSARYNPANTNMLLNYIAQYDPTNYAQGPIGPPHAHPNLLYYITSPLNLSAAAQDPIRCITYIAFMALFAVIFAKIWVEVGGLSPKAAAQSLIDAQIQVPGFRRTSTSIESMLTKYIPSITIIGGIIIGLIAGVSTLLGVFGTGIGILLMVMIIIQYYQTLMRERLETMMPRLAGILGKK